MAKLKKKNKISILSDVQTSFHLVDLAEKMKKEEEKMIRAVESTFSFKVKKKHRNIKDFFGGKKNSLKQCVLNSFQSVKNIFSYKVLIKNNLLNIVSNYFYFFSNKRYKKLSFYFIFNLISRLSYATGWVVVFGIRFAVMFFVVSYQRTSDKIIFYLEARKRYQAIKLNEFRVLQEAELMHKLALKQEKLRQKEERVIVPRPKFEFSFDIRKLVNIVPSFRWSLTRQMAIFFVLALVLIFPLKTYLHYRDFLKFKGEVLGVSASAVDDMKSSSGEIKNLNLSEATKNFADATKNFQSAQSKINELNVVFNALAQVVPNKKIKLASQADLYLRAGELTANVANRIGGSLELFNTKDLKIKDVLNVLYENLNSSNAEIIELGEILKKIDLDALPDEYRDKVAIFQQSSADISKTFVELTKLVDGTRKILGFERDRRYLIIFQNNTEMRGSGGFVGSYALADFKNGEMTNLEVPTGGSYDTEAGYLTRVSAPEPLQLVNPLWHFWDANWWPDWAMSAKKLMWFYEKSNGPTVDGVIAITPNVMADLLKVIGPLDMREKYGVVIDGDNFWDEVQAIVEKKPEIKQVEAPVLSLVEGSTTLVKVAEVKHEPKKIIGDMMNMIIAKMSKDLNKDGFINILFTAYNNLNEKHILTYFVDEDLEKLVSDFDWGGLMENVDGDYLMVANSNIAGAKSDKKIKESISLLREVQTDGSIVNTLKIQRRHTAIRGDEFVGVRNVDWLRVYVPDGSEIIEADGFSQPDGKFFEKPSENWNVDEDVMRGEGNFTVDPRSGTKIYKELGKTVFANWTMVDPGEQVVITIKYRIPFKVERKKSEEPKGFFAKLLNDKTDDSYVPLKLLVQKQPGSQGSEFVSSLLLPKNMQVTWQNNESMQFRNKLNVDRNWMVLIRITN